MLKSNPKSKKSKERETTSWEDLYFALEQNKKIKKIEDSKLFASLKKTIIGLEQNVLKEEDMYVETKKNYEACGLNIKELYYSLPSAKDTRCLEEGAKNMKAEEARGYIDKLLDSLLAVDIDYAKTVKKQDEETKKLKNRLKICKIAPIPKKN